MTQFANNRPVGDTQSGESRDNGVNDLVGGARPPESPRADDVQMSTSYRNAVARLFRSVVANPAMAPYFRHVYKEEAGANNWDSNLRFVTAIESARSWEAQLNIMGQLLNNSELGAGPFRYYLSALLDEVRRVLRDDPKSAEADHALGAGLDMLGRLNVHVTTPSCS